MESIREADALDKTPRPCDYFDLIGGTSTGGIIAIMLGRLQMSVDECLRAYKVMAETAFTPKKGLHLPARPTGAFSATALEKAIKSIVETTIKNETTVENVVVAGQCSQNPSDDRKRAAAETLFRDDTRCKTAVLAITKSNVNALPTLFKTYDKTESLKNCTIWQVARATSAATTFFKSIKCGRDEIEFIDAGFGYNNPCEILLQEARAVFPDAEIRSVVSIGTGLGGIVRISDTRASILKALKKMATNSQQVADRLEAAYPEGDIYFRFHVSQGLEDVVLSDWKESSTIAAHTRNYLAVQNRSVAKCSGSIRHGSSLDSSNRGAREVDKRALKTALSALTPDLLKNQYFQVPFDTNMNYVERPSITDQLERLFGYKEPTAAYQRKRVVLHGLGGSGKTELAVRFAERHRQHYLAVFWVHGSDESRLQDGFERIGKTVSKGNSGVYGNYVIEAQEWFTNKSNWLLIVDNVNDDTALDALRGRYLKGGMDGHVIVTSRNPTTSARWNGVEVADMERSEAITLMLKITGQHNRHEDSTLTELLEDLGHLPLAIDQASSYIAATKISLQGYREWFRTEKARLLKQLPSTHYNYDSRETVMTTWELSFKHIEKFHVTASKLLLMMSLFSHDNVPIDMLKLNSNSLRQWAPNGEFEELPEAQEWVSPELKPILQNSLSLREAILALRKFSFVRYTPRGNSMWIHPLVHYWASQRLDSHPDRQPLTMCSIGLVASSFGKEDRLPPIATPYGRRDVASVLEEKSLRLWPWRQYPTLASHAHSCMRHVTTLTYMPESMAHLSLSLLQVLDYLSNEEEPVKSYRLSIDHAHNLMDHVAKFGEAPDNFLNLSILLWRLTRMAVCTCQKQAVGMDLHMAMEKRCYRCNEAFNELRKFTGIIEKSSGKLVTTARIRAASLGLLFVISLGDSSLKSTLTREVGHSWEDPFGSCLRITPEDLVLNEAPFNNWYRNSIELLPQMEKYVYNMGRYLVVRFASEYYKGSINYRLAEQVAKVFKELCGPHSEEYRRSVWYLTTSLVDKEAWAEVRDYLKPLVRESVENPIYSWSHERCVIRLADALIQMGDKEEACQVLKGIQKSIWRCWKSFTFHTAKSAFGTRRLQDNAKGTMANIRENTDWENNNYKQ